MEKVRFYLDTNYSVAKDSFDYQFPIGAYFDNSRRPEFNEELKNYPGSVLDIGCAGGGFVKDCVDEGRLAVGLEGCDYNKRFGKFEWVTIPNNLFNCDVTKPFILHTGNNKPHQFNIITLWEVFEHFTYEELYPVLDNIKMHLSPNGLIFATTSQGHSYHKLYKEVDLHRTRKNRDWWIRRFSEANLIEVPEIEKQFENKFLRDSKTNNKFVLRENV